jgi:predicted DNA-binding transcriptional regulator AlpA
MLMVIGVLIFIFECQHIMALFAYANSLARINRKAGNTGTSGNTDSSPAPLGESAPVSAFAPLADSAKQTVAEFAKKVEQGLKSAPEIVATEYARADFANKQVLADAGRIGGKIGAKLDDALNAENRKNHPQKIQFPVGEGKTADDYDLIPRTDKTPTLSGENTVKYLTPKMSVADTVKHIQASVKQSGASSPAAIQAAVFDAFAAMPNPAPLGDDVLNRLAEKLAEKSVTTVHAQPEQTRTEAQPEQHEQPVTTVHAQPEQTMPELTAAAKQAESDLYPEWVKQVSAKAITSGARDSKRFISQATFTHCPPLNLIGAINMINPATFQTFDFKEWKQKLQQKKPDMPIGVRLIDMHEIVMKTGYSRSTINRWRKAGTFPDGTLYGSSTRRWLESDIDAWIYQARG